MKVKDIQKEPDARPERCVIHWTGGGHQASVDDYQHYHFIIEGDGDIKKGRYSIADNNTTATPYAAHVRGLNSGSIGIALAGMGGSTETPFYRGDWPLNELQFTVLFDLCTHLFKLYALPISAPSLLTHAEVSTVYPSAPQRGKWDITYCPLLAPDALLPASEVGGYIRTRVQRKLFPTASTSVEDILRLDVDDLPAIGPGPSCEYNIRKLQGLVGAEQDGWIGPETYSRIVENVKREV